MKTERESFEEWAKKETNWDLYWSENIKQYMDHQTNGAWFAWIASAQREGYKIMSVEPTDKTIAHMINTPIEVNLLCDHADTFLSEGEAYIAYKAMIGAAP